MTKIGQNLTSAEGGRVPTTRTKITRYHVPNKKKLALNFALRRHKRQITDMFTRTNNKTQHVELKHKYSKSHSTEKRNVARVLVLSVVLEGRWCVSANGPVVTPPVGFLPEIGKSSGILATLGVSVEHFGITLHTEGLTLTTGGLYWTGEKRHGNLSRLYSRTEQCNLIWWQVIIEFDRNLEN